MIEFVQISFLFWCKIEKTSKEKKYFSIKIELFYLGFVLQERYNLKINKIMKKIIVFSVALIYSVFAYSQIEFLGYLTNQENKKLKQVTVNLYEDNTLVSSTVFNLKFNYTFEPNKHYTIEIVKDGFFTKRIAVSTVDAAVTSDPFSFIVELTPKDESIDEAVFDFPTAIIEYKKSKKTFSFNETYAKSVKKEQEAVLSN